MIKGVFLQKWIKYKNTVRVEVCEQWSDWTVIFLLLFYNCVSCWFMILKYFQSSNDFRVVIIVQPCSHTAWICYISLWHFVKLKCYAAPPSPRWPHYTLHSTCLSVYPMPTINSKTENRTQFKRRGKVSHDRCSWRCTFEGGPHIMSACAMCVLYCYMWRVFTKWGLTSKNQNISLIYHWMQHTISFKMSYYLLWYYNICRRYSGPMMDI